MLLLSMKSRSEASWQQELTSRIIAEVNSYFENQLQKRIQEAIEEIKKQTEKERRVALNTYGIDVEDEGIPPIYLDERDVPEPMRESITELNGSSSVSERRPSRRKMILEVIPEFHGNAFSQPEVRTKILQKWPEADAPSLASGIANLLKEMAEKGHLERLEGEDPVQYREKQNREGSLDLE